MMTAQSVLSKDEATEKEERGPDTHEMLRQCMEDWHHSAHAESPDYDGMAHALRSAHEILMSEEEHEDEEKGGD